MRIKISAVGYGAGAISIAGAIFLAAIGNSAWSTFLVVGFFLVVIGALIRKI